MTVTLTLFATGVTAVTVSRLLRCRHQHEVLHFAEVGQRTGPRIPNAADAGSIPALGSKMARVSPTGNTGGLQVEPEGTPRAMLYCPDCGRTRPHPWSGEPARFHRTQKANYSKSSNSSPTGIERVRAEAEQRRQAVAGYERSMRLYVMGENVRRKYQGRA